eukprot:CAMPEP_0206375670 /NCGR_PEP_ID=MMETSP0294-20121207/9012_1 /ASSEMBLY_ACC=CAM_ASM_000327 /TAXON_ID=39354 /ORGANISM="Heterosigma akashiwo, Strain CCMP2393" /LENGTH=464 /DNA_ID=CAMNT_0053823623 /DNA_START=138 /DNA_END=1532 /DNA_ORIENTATION=+
MSKTRSVGTSSRYIINDSPAYESTSLRSDDDTQHGWRVGEPAAEDIQQYFESAIQDLIPQEGDPICMDYSLYTGTGGISYAFLHLAEISKNQQQKERYLGWASHFFELAKDCWLKYDRRSLWSEEIISFVLGPSGILGLQIWLGKVAENQAMMEEGVQGIMGFKDLVLTTDQDNEILYGRAGYLFSLLWARKHAGEQSVPNDVITEVTDKIFQEGQVLQPRSGHLMYEWHRSRYLGGAHGVTGIVTILLQALEAVHPGGLEGLRQVWAQQQQQQDEMKGAAAEEKRSEGATKLSNQLVLLRNTMDFLVELQLPDGNLPTRPEDRARERAGSQDALVQWCHGAPGLLQAALAAYRLFEDQRYLDSAKAAAQIIWTKGILTKGNGLCHGVSGNGYCFLQLHAATGDPEALYRAQQFGRACASPAVARRQRAPDRPLSLFEGLAGELLFLADLLARPGQAAFPAVFL